MVMLIAALAGRSGGSPFLLDKVAWDQIASAMPSAKDALADARRELTGYDAVVIVPRSPLTRRAVAVAPPAPFQTRFARDPIVRSTMRIGVPKEIKTQEFRVGMTPAGVAILVARGHTVLVEQGAGVGSAIPDEAYVKAGAKIVADARRGLGRPTWS